jgi:serine phosphatase RsbU (regulator of sigma subunit)/Tfp pilus assembly protein PilF
VKTVTIIVLLLLVGKLTCHASIDSLKNCLKPTLKDTAKATIYYQLGYAYFETDGSLDSSKVYFTKALELYKKNNNNKYICKALIGRGLINREKGLYNEGLKDHIDAIDIAEKLKDSTLLTSCYNGLAIIHSIQSDFKNAFEYYQKAINIHKKQNNHKGLASIYNNLGLLFSAQNQSDSALYYFNSALDYNTLNNNLRGIATNCENIGLLFLEHDKNPEKAIENFSKSLIIWRSMNDINSVAITLDYMCMALLEQKNYQKCVDTATLSLQLAKEAGNILYQRNSYEKLYIAHNKLANYKEALSNYISYIDHRDSLSNSDQIREFTELQLSYEFEKQTALKALEQEVKDIETNEKLSSQNKIIKLVIFSLFILLVLLFFIWRGFLRNKKARKKITLQSQLLESRNKEITDSILYAKRIQSAILPPNRILHERLKDYFILYKPKDIVAGDFYWLETTTPIPPPLKGAKGEVVFLAAADCTGHGVPGAMVSVVCNNGLNRSVREHGITDTGKILEKTREIIIQEFEKSDDEVKDGMDISLCSLSVDDFINDDFIRMQWSGANNPLWIIRKESEIIEEIKGDKQPIGKHDDAKPFKTHIIHLQKGDTFYLFTDGYQDQFGGEKGKKFKASQLKELLISIASYSMNEQKRILDDTIEKWKGNLEQVDDICIIGVRL